MVPFESDKIEISPEATVLMAIDVISRGGIQIALVVDSSRRLLGTVTDGDIRRAILRGEPLSQAVSRIMNSKPATGRPDEPKKALIERMKSRFLRQLPLLDANGKVVGIEIFDHLVSPTPQKNWVVLMAGGEGTRLQPLTQETPKPLLPIGSKPLLETIITNFQEQGFPRFYVAVNYKADMITDYFGNGEKWGIHIEYLRERQKLGTAGALTLIQETPSEPIIVMNGDLLTKVNFQQLLDFHRAHEARATCCVRTYDFEVPYGVVALDKENIVGIDEKPRQQFFVSAGIYVLDPSVLALLPKDQSFDMPQLLRAIIDRKEPVAAYPIREYWLDIGRMDDFQRANLEFTHHFDEKSDSN